MITLYSTDCPRCKVLERKLSSLPINFQISYDINKVAELGFMEAPILQINDQYLNFSEAIKWIKEQG